MAKENDSHSHWPFFSIVETENVFSWEYFLLIKELIKAVSFSDDILLHKICTLAEYQGSVSFSQA